MEHAQIRHSSHSATCVQLHWRALTLVVSFGLATVAAPKVAQARPQDMQSSYPLRSEHSKHNVVHQTHGEAESSGRNRVCLSHHHNTPQFIFIVAIYFPKITKISTVYSTNWLMLRLSLKRGEEKVRKIKLMEKEREMGGGGWRKRKYEKNFWKNLRNTKRKLIGSKMTI